LNAQFGAWRNGTRKAAAPDCMAQIAAKMTPGEISAASAWLASQPIAPDMRPAPPLTTRLPIPCGTVTP
jgi:cytochrome c553